MSIACRPLALDLARFCRQPAADLKRNGGKKPMDILLLILALVAAVIAFIAMQPTEFSVKRSALIAAPAERIFLHVNDLHAWDAWSPWVKLDPQAKNSFEGPQAGVGASMYWIGNSKVGEGRMTIVDSQPHSHISFRLDFRKPMAATSQAEFTFTPQAGQTLVTWRMTGSNNFVGKAMNLVMNCDKMVGGQFENGLASLRAVATGAS